MSRSARRARHRRCRLRSYPPITGLADACAAAWAVRAEFPRGHAGFLLDFRGEVEDAVALTGEEHTAECVLGLLATRQPPGSPPSRSVLLISPVGDDDLDVLPEDDVRLWYRLEGESRRHGLTLLDWLHVTPESVRLMRMATTGEFTRWR
jgi:hypothetical protein